MGWAMRQHSFALSLPTFPTPTCQLLAWADDRVPTNRTTTGDTSLPSAARLHHPLEQGVTVICLRSDSSFSFSPGFSGLGYTDEEG